jgi:MinD-like ATPase involved in chromosome partitioning or flagellar assembly
MAVLALVSAKGSPGVTTAAAALGGVVAGDSSGGDGGGLLVELDPSGGDVTMLCDRVGEATLVSLAEELRHSTPASGTLREHTVEGPPGMPAVLAPPGASEAAGVIGSLGDRWLPALRGAAGTVVVDAGRWEPHAPTARRIAGADVVGVVCRATAPSVEHTRRVVDAIRGTARCPLAVLVVGARPYPGDEIATVLDVPLAGVLAWDPRGVTGLWTHGARGRGRRSWLTRSAKVTLAGLEALAPVRSAQARPVPHKPVGGGVR